MKHLFLLAAFSFSMGFVCKGQDAPTFTKTQQSEIKRILGKEYVPVFSSKGELAIATKESVSSVKPLAGGGFSSLKASAAKNVFIHKGWIYKSSYQAALNDMKSKLGEERFKQLEAVLKPSSTK